MLTQSLSRGDFFLAAFGGGYLQEPYLRSGRRILQSKGAIAKRSAYRFGHGAVHQLGGGLPALVDAYHPSQQNTQTGKLTEAMFRQVFERVRG